MKTNEKKLGQEPIIPTIFRQIGDNDFRVATEKDIKDSYATLFHTEGISKRLYIATMAMKGIISNFPTNPKELQFEMESILKAYGNIKVGEAVAMEAFMYADELLKQENK